MTALLALLSLLSALALTSTAVSLVVLHRSHVLLNGAEPRHREPQPDNREFQELRQSVEALAAQINDLRKEPPAPMEAVSPRPGLNLSKRSQALRMHRHGESTGQIASRLDLPRQEIDLLVKVHRIVLSRV